MLARGGVTPQVAQRIMRHASYSTTLKHYTALTLRDDAAAIARLVDPSEAEQEAIASAAGSEGRAAFRHVERAGECRSVPVGPVGHGRGPNGGDGLGGSPSPLEGVTCEERAKGLEPSTFSLEG
jgi:hypothetical protein